MIAVTLSAVEIFILGVCSGIIAGVIGLAAVATLYTKSKKK